MRCNEVFSGVDGIIVPGGFGDRGIEGMIQAAQYAREQNIPYFGICLGMQIMVMEYAPRCAGLCRCQFQRVYPRWRPQCYCLDGRPAGQHPQGRHHASGQVPLHYRQGHQAGKCYGNKEEIDERHRHRYEFNNDYRQRWRSTGLSSPVPARMAVWWKLLSCAGCDFHLGVQFHPEFRAAPTAHIPCSRALSLLRQNEQEHTITDHDGWQIHRHPDTINTTRHRTCNWPGALFLCVKATPHNSRLAA